MKGNALLEYAEFQLSPKRTRCELIAWAEGGSEKLASGLLKPFLTHLRAVEVELARGSQVIRLEGHRGTAWLTKGTLERFVRFVSTPEIIERVKTIDDELCQLQQVRSALANTFWQDDEGFANRSPGILDERDGMRIGLRRQSYNTDESASDMSKRELLRAMDARLMALHQEQNAAFARAMGAGFDSSTMADLMMFAEHFGAGCLKEACSQFFALYRKYTISEGVNKNSNTNRDTLCDDVLRGSFQIDSALMNIESASDCSAQSLQNFYTCEDKGVHASPKSIEKGFSLPSHACSTVANQHERFSMSQDEGRSTINNTKASHAKPSSATEEAPVRRLSVQAAISLFESKKNDNGESPVKKLVKQESRRAMMEAGNSPSEKSVLRRWSTVDQPSSGESSSQEKGCVSRNKEVERTQEGEMMDIKKDETNKDCFGKSIVNQDDLNFQNLGYVCSREGTDISGQHDGECNDDSMPPHAYEHPVGRIGLPKYTEEDVKILPSVEDLKQKSIQLLGEKVISSGMAAFAGSRPPSEITECKHGSVTTVNGAYDCVASAPGNVTSNAPKMHTLQPASDTLASTRVQLTNKAAKQPKQQAAPIVSKQEMTAIDKSYPVQVNEPSVAAGQPGAGSGCQQISQGGQSSEISGAGEVDAAKNDSQQTSYARVNVSGASGQPAFKCGSLSSARSDSQQASKNAPFNEACGAGKVDAAKSDSERTSHAAQANEVVGASGQHFPRSNSQQTSHCRESKLAKKRSALSCPTNVDLHMQVLDNIVQGQQEGISSPSNGDTLKGRFYEHYSKLREAKLKCENPAKKAEREAKLKSMQETFERRKAEMQVRAPRVIKRFTGVAAKQGTLKPGYPTTQMELPGKDKDGANAQEEYFAKHGSACSPASTPKSQVAQSKHHTLKKNASTPKSSSAQRISSHAGVSTSPPTSTIRNTPALSSQGKLNAEAMDCSAMQKTKLLPSVRVGASARVHPSHMQTTSDPSLAGESTVVAKQDTPGMVSSEEVRPEPLLTRSMMPPRVLGPPLRQQEVSIDIRPNSFTSREEIRPFLRKGRGIGSGAGPVFMKQKLSIQDASRSCEDESMVDANVHSETVDWEDAKKTGEEVAKDGAEVVMDDSILIPAQDSVDVSSMDGLDVHDADGSVKDESTYGTKAVEEEEEAFLPDNVFNLIKPDSLPDEVSEEDFQDSSGDAFSTLQGSFLQMQNPKQNGSMSQSISQLFGQRNELLQGDSSFVASSISFREPDKQSVAYSSAQMTSCMVHQVMASAHFSPTASIVSDCSIDSPMLWGSVQARYPNDADLLYATRSFGGAPKHASLSPLPAKEASKGFKRLLHFGRKNRASETAAADCISVSTTSEGDDDSEEVGSQPGGDVIRKPRMYQKKGVDFGNTGESYSYKDPVQSCGTTIPPPPINFKPREDQLHGGNFLKAPRSFFSLSSFRSSKSTEGKSR